MQVEPTSSNRKAVLWLGRNARRDPSGLGSRGGETRNRNNQPGDDDLDDDWEKDDSALSEFMQPRHLMDTRVKPNSSSLSANKQAKQTRKAVRKAANRMRRREPQQKQAPAAPSNDLSDLLEMPKWEHPAPQIYTSQSSNSRRGDASSKASKGRLGQMLDGGDSDEDENEGRGTYLQSGIVGGRKSSGRSRASQNSVRSKRGSAASASSLGSKSIALHLAEPDTDDESTGVELFRPGGGGRRSALDDDDDGSISSASVECFKPKPSKQEMAQTLLRSFDAELRMEAEKSKEGRSGDRKERTPSISASSPQRSHTIPHAPNRQRDIGVDITVEHEKPIETFVAPQREPNARHTSNGQIKPTATQARTASRSSATSALLNSIPATPAPVRNQSAGVPDLFNNSLRFDDLELNGSCVNFEDFDPSIGGHHDDLDDDDQSISMQSDCGSVVSVDMMSDRDKEDLEEKMIRMAMERSLSDSCSVLDDVVPFSVQGHGSGELHSSGNLHFSGNFNASGNFAVIDIGNEDDDEVERMAEIELAREIELAIKRSLNDSKASELTANTFPITSEWSGSSGTSNSAGQPHHFERQRQSTGKVPSSPNRRQSGTTPSSNYNNASGSQYPMERNVPLSSQRRQYGTTSSSSSSNYNDESCLHYPMEQRRSGASSHYVVAGQTNESGSHYPTEQRRSGTSSRHVVAGSVSSHHSHGADSTGSNGAPGYPRSYTRSVGSTAAYTDQQNSPRRIVRPRPQHQPTTRRDSGGHGKDDRVRASVRRPARNGRHVQDI